MHRFIGAATVVLAAALSGTAQAEILIGVAGPTGTGRLSWAGQQMERGSGMAIAQTNAEGGVFGQQVRLIVADDACDSEQAVGVARKLVADGVKLVVGHLCSGASIPASEVYEAAGVVQISPASTNPLLTEQGRANVFRVIGRDDTQGIVAGDYLADHWAEKKIAILHDGTTYGKSLADETKAQLNKRGVAEAIYQTYVPGKAEYSADIIELQAGDIAAVYVGGYHPDVALMARAASDNGYSVQFISGDSLATEEFSLIAGPAAEGTLFTFSPDPRQHPEAASVVEKFRAEKFEPDSFTLLSYAAVQVWVQAVGKAGSLESQPVIASLHANSFDTVLGTIAFDEKGDLSVQSWIWYVWKGGEYVPLK